MGTFCNVYILYHFYACFVDTACVAADYKEQGNNQAVAVTYGIIKSMFIARVGNEPEEIVVECDWYEKVGINARTKLTQVRLNRAFDTCRVAFLKNMFPRNFVNVALQPQRPAKRPVRCHPAPRINLLTPACGS